MPGVLGGLKVLDFTTLLPGPFATMILADMGAEVLRIASGSRPDLVSESPPFIPGTKISAAEGQLGRTRCLCIPPAKVLHVGFGDLSSVALAQ